MQCHVSFSSSFYKYDTVSGKGVLCIILGFFLSLKYLSGPSVVDSVGSLRVVVRNPFDRSVWRVPPLLQSRHDKDSSCVLDLNQYFVVYWVQLRERYFIDRS